MTYVSQSWVNYWGFYWVYTKEKFYNDYILLSSRIVVNAQG